jgi:D-serine dehydratase
MTRQHDRISVRDFGLDNKTDADGLAVGRPSGFVGQTLEKLISGVYTVADDNLYISLVTLADSENVYTEPSAMAGMPGPARLLKSTAGQKYIENQLLGDKIKNAAHIAWATGGSMVPAAVMKAYYEKGRRLLTGVPPPVLE